MGEAFWKKAEDYLAQYLCDQYKKKNGLDPTAAEQKSRYVTRKAAEPLRMENHQQLHKVFTQLKLGKKPDTL